ncbi:metalloregulator ArsR/SmtB family transcription factor [Plantactinospora mayteni]|uniref:Transcriptional regulator n=1 Tax=Plantactinospora mayteni TaxID=566021 RepID=A0ABQ4F0P4_9ACTN|nr:metalloregulator ArsR/SmtB family transcription factor [Plantactinospora mayteni]GIH00487.1 transcriptional regulator [Plantactinospora mayteni]
MTQPQTQVLAALADPTRWHVLQTLAERGEQTATQLAGPLPVSRPAVIKHLTTLQQHGLVSSRRRGREVLYSANPSRLIETARWMANVAATWEAGLLRLRALAEDTR